MPKNGLQISLTILRIATLFVAEPDCGLWNYIIAKKLNMHDATTFDNLERLVVAGWLTSDWEKPNERLTAAGSPKRKLYRITKFGMDSTRRALADLKL
jgi:Transcriptional regulator PadR-like family